MHHGQNKLEGGKARLGKISNSNISILPSLLQFIQLLFCRVNAVSEFHVPSIHRQYSRPLEEDLILLKQVTAFLTPFESFTKHASAEFSGVSSIILIKETARNYLKLLNVLMPLK